MKKIWILVVFLFDCAVSKSQATPPNKYFGSYTQPAPNAAALGKYVDYPVGYYTGTPNISIPLFNLQDGAAKVPISLSYHASGIRVSETASWAGLGWALNAGGLITRSVRGGPDEGVYGAGGSPAGYYLDSGIRKMPLLPHPTGNVIPISQEAADRAFWLTQLNAGKIDCEPDLFTFNFNGYSGKFVFDELKTPHLLSDDNLKIAVSFSSGSFNSWVITTPDGARYYFGENSMNEVSVVASSQSITDFNTQKPSSWYLTRIIYPNTKDTVYFNYTQETYGYYDLGQETKIFDGSPPSGFFQQACAFNGDDNPQIVYKTTVTGQRLTSIKSRNYNLVFAARTARQDLLATAYELDSLKIFNAVNQCIKQYLFTYSYFTSTTAGNIPAAALSYMSSDVTDTKRLKLLSVKEFSGDGLISKPAYLFTYQEAHQLPRRMSYDQDHWGFCNNYAGDRNSRFTPKVSHPICTSNIGAPANRDPSWPDMQYFSIKAIKDPLGAFTTFEFEAHSSQGSSPAAMVGGLRIHKITVTDSLTGISQVRSFDYGAGGVLYKEPQYLVSTQNEYYFPTGGAPTGPSVSYQGYWSSFNPVLIALIRQSQSVVPMQDFQGNHIGYPIVKEILGPNGEGGSNIYYYMADQLFSNSRLHMDNYTASATISTDFGNTSGIYGNGHFNDILPQNTPYFMGFMANYYWPKAPEQVDFRRGQLLGEDTYDSSHILVKSVRNYYKETYHENYWLRGFKLFRTPVLNSGGQAFNDALTYYRFHTGISHIISTTTNDYKDGKIMTVVHNYGYEDSLHTMQTSDTSTNSLGETIINKTYYSFDYDTSATADHVFARMLNRNMLLPVATRTWKNNQLIDGSIIMYKDFASAGTDSFINPIKKYALETISPLTVAQANENVAFTSPYTTLIPNSYFVEMASFNVDGSKGKVIEQKLTSDKNQALIWDNTKSLPIAVVDNGYFSDVAFSSFETSETGNWTYSAGSVVTDATAPTGTSAYSLGSAISKSINASTKYLLSYWSKSGASVTVTGGTQTNAVTGRTLNGWTYHEITLTGTSSVSVNGSGYVDEIRLYPSSAQMTTYTYDPFMRLIGQCSVNSTISYYEYDSLDRLIDIKDQYGNIVKVWEYNFGRKARPGN